MTTIGWTLMLLTWGVLGAILCFCYKKVLTDKGDKVSDLED